MENQRSPGFGLECSVRNPGSGLVLNGIGGVKRGNRRRQQRIRRLGHPKTREYRSDRTMPWDCRCPRASVFDKDSFVLHFICNTSPSFRCGRNGMCFGQKLEDSPMRCRRHYAEIKCIRQLRESEAEAEICEMPLLWEPR